MGEMGRMADGRDGEIKEVNIHGRPSLHNINLTSSPVITSRFNKFISDSLNMSPCLSWQLLHLRHMVAKYTTDCCD